jgi:hypothetical protein
MFNHSKSSILDLSNFLTEEKRRTDDQIILAEINLFQFIIDDPWKVNIYYASNVIFKVIGLIRKRFTYLTWGNDLSFNIRSETPIDFSRELILKDEMDEIYALRQIAISVCLIDYDSENTNINGSIPVILPEILYLIGDIIFDDYAFNHSAEIVNLVEMEEKLIDYEIELIYKIELNNNLWDEDKENYWDEEFSQHIEALPNKHKFKNTVIKLFDENDYIL